MVNQLSKQTKKIEAIIALMESLGFFCNDFNHFELELVNTLDSIQESFLKLLAFGFEKGVFLRINVGLTTFDMLKLAYCLFRLGFTFSQLRLIWKIIKTDHSFSTFYF